MGRREAETGRSIEVSRELALAAIHALRSGANAVLDRDWDYYSPEERIEAERYARTAFLDVADELERPLRARS